MVDQVIETSTDTFLDQASATTTRDTHSSLFFRGGGTSNHPVFRFNISSLSGKSLDSVTLNLKYNLSPAPLANGVEIYISYITRAIVYTQATWTIFASGSNWGTSGGTNVTDNDHATRVLWDLTGAHVQGETITSPDITPLVQKALIEDGTNLDIIMYGEGSGTPGWFFDSLESSGGSRTPPFLQVMNVEDMETTTSSSPGNGAVNVAVPSATVLSQSGRPPIAGADRQVTASVLHDGVEPMTILSITLKGAYGSDN